MGIRPVEQIAFSGDGKEVTLTFTYSDGENIVKVINVKDHMDLARVLNEQLGQRKLPNWANNLLIWAVEGHVVTRHICADIT